jgi:hypothetical protein
MPSLVGKRRAWLAGAGWKYRVRFRCRATGATAHKAEEVATGLQGSATLGPVNQLDNWRSTTTPFAARPKKADELYRWFLPLLRMDTVPKFVQLIKLVQQEVGMGHERVRAPRCVMAGAERKVALKVLKTALANRPKL